MWLKKPWPDLKIYGFAKGITFLHGTTVPKSGKSLSKKRQKGVRSKAISLAMDASIIHYGRLGIVGQRSVLIKVNAGPAPK